MNAIAIISSILALSFGIYIIFNHKVVENLRSEANELECELEREKKAGTYMANDVHHLRELLYESEQGFKRYKRDSDMYYRWYTEKTDKLNTLESNLKDVMKDRDMYKELHETNKKIVSHPYETFYAPIECVNPLVYQFTARGSDLHLPESFLEGKIRKELSESIASLFDIKLIESRDASGHRKDAQVKFILKQLDYDI